MVNFVIRIKNYGPRRIANNANKTKTYIKLLARISHQDYGRRRRMEPACLTRWTSPHLIFESTKHFAQSEIHPVIPLLRKILCDKSVWNGFGPHGDPGGVKYRDVFHQSKSLRDHLAPW